MATVAARRPAREAQSAPAVAPPPAPPANPVRQGTCALTLHIGGTQYKLRPMPPHAEIAHLWTLSKRQPDPLKEPVAYAVASDAAGRKAACTCPDFEYNGAVCKHIGALRALRLIPGPAAPPAPAEPPAPEPNGRIEEGWQPGGKATPAPSPAQQAEEFRGAVRAEVKRRRKARGPEPCLDCGAPLSDDAVSPDPALCRSCYEGGAL
jgi:hypothetical protein